MNKITSFAKSCALSYRFSSTTGILCISLAVVLLAGCNTQVAEPEPGQNQSSDPQAGVVGSDQPVEILTIDEVAQSTAAATTPQRVAGDDANARPRAMTEERLQAGNNVLRAPVQSASQGLVYAGNDADRAVWYRGEVTNRENYLAIDENTIKRVNDEPLSTFSIDVDTAAYSNVRRMLTREGRLPPHDAVRLEEMINYFDYDYTAPDNLDQPLAVHTELMASPWNPNNQLLMVGIKGFEQDLDLRPNANLVFLVDVSGSMQSQDKLGLVKRSLQLLVSQMQEDDRIALVVYAGRAGMVLDSTPASEKSKILSAIESLSAGGSTNGAAGIQLAYRIAEENKIDDGINRVIIASDGDLNVGVTSIDDLIELISKKRENGIALTSLGYGTGNYNYSLMEQIADAGNGNAAYIDTLSEARKVLITEMQSTLQAIAKDVKIQIEFNPEIVAEYRLLGYENRILNREDFRNDKVDAGEIGAGHTVTALYEISLAGSAGRMIPERRYSQPQESTTDYGDELAYVNIRYKMPGQDQSTEFGVAVQSQEVREDSTDNIRFAAAVAGFGQLLRGGKHTGDWNYDALLQLARQSRGEDEHGYRSELVKLVELAQVL
jgi:Ca-activated chloride channel family protein